MKNRDSFLWAFLLIAALYFAVQIFSCGRPPLGDVLSPLSSPGLAAQKDSIRFYYFGLAPGVYHQSGNSSTAWWGDVPAARPSRTRIWWLVYGPDDGEGNRSVTTLWLRDPHARIAGGLRMRPMTGATQTTSGRMELRRTW